MSSVKVTPSLTTPPFEALVRPKQRPDTKHIQRVMHETPPCTAFQTNIAHVVKTVSHQQALYVCITVIRHLFALHTIKP